MSENALDNALNEYYIKPWEEYTELEQAHQMYSDYYKDVNGFRPRNDVSDWTLEDFDKAMDELSKEMEVVIEEQNQMHMEASQDFVKLIEQTIACGAADKKMALEWLRQAEEDDYMKYDDGYFEYSYHLPYGYLKENGYVS